MGRPKKKETSLEKTDGFQTTAHGTAHVKGKKDMPQRDKAFSMNNTSQSNATVKRNN